jgi:hypothetical protein
MFFFKTKKNKIQMSSNFNTLISGLGLTPEQLAALKCPSNPSGLWYAGIITYVASVVLYAVGDRVSKAGRGASAGCDAMRMPIVLFIILGLLLSIWNVLAHSMCPKDDQAFWGDSLQYTEPVLLGWNSIGAALAFVYLWCCGSVRM